MRRLSIVAWMATAGLAAGCGGGSQTLSGAPSPGGGGNNPHPVATLAVTSSATSIPSDGSASATITVVAKDSSNAAVSGATVTFAASAGNVTVTQGTTDTTGTATATLVSGSAAAGATITVTATSGAVSGKVAITVSNATRQVTLVTSSPQIASDGTAPATITALVRDSNNNFVSGAPVVFVSTSGGIAPASPTSGTNGTVAAVLTTAGDPTNRAIKVTASVGATTASITVNVVGTTLTLSGPSSLVQASQGTYNVSLADSGKNAIPGATVTLASADGNTLSAATLTTDSSGHGSFTVTGTKAGTDSISAAALGLSATQSVAVSNQVFAFTSPAATSQIPLNLAVPVTVNWASNGGPVVGKTVTFAATRGTLSAQSAPTDAQGNATVSIRASSGGPAILSASGTGVTATQNVTFIATAPNSMALQASPSTISIKGQSTITAIVRDAQNNLVQGETVAFQLTDVTGGQLSFATAITDPSGVAQTVYTASGTPSTSNGVSVLATVQGTAISQTVDLTVGGQTVFLSLGTGNKISENPTQTQFNMPWVVTAVDSAGHPVNGVTITLTIHSASRPYYAYYKGTYEVCGSSWVQYNGTPGCTITAPIGSTTAPVPCLNEDLNLTGVYEASEDINNNNRLDPGDVAVTNPGNVVTGTAKDSSGNPLNDGSATFQVDYPEDHALWVQTTLTATATVQGTQSTTTSTFILPILATYLTTTTSSPPGFVSPYGSASSCANPN